jgi:hypothetical protein
MRSRTIIILIAVSMFSMQCTSKKDSPRKMAKLINLQLGMSLDSIKSLTGNAGWVCDSSNEVPWYSTVFRFPDISLPNVEHSLDASLHFSIGRLSNFMIYENPPTDSVRVLTRIGIRTFRKSLYWKDYRELMTALEAVCGTPRDSGIILSTSKYEAIPKDSLCFTSWGDTVKGNQFYVLRYNSFDHNIYYLGKYWPKFHP